MGLAREHALLCCPFSQARYNVMEALVYLGPFTTAFLTAGAFAFEWDQGLATTVSGCRVQGLGPSRCALEAKKPPAVYKAAPDASHSSVAGR